VNDKYLGRGTFSSVFAAANDSKKLVALKAVRSQEYFRKYANKEVAIMLRIRDSCPKDPEGAANVLNLTEHFMFGEHLCIVMDKMGTSLREFGRQPLEKVISFSKQLLLALRFLHDGVGLMHCDVKPDNLLVRHDGMAVKLCDFGAAGFTKEKQQVDELQPLFYRAPEVLIGAPRGRKIDIWSVGCTIFELAVGRILFRDCNSVRDCVEKIMRLRGAIPEHMRKQGRHTKTFFSEEGFQPEAGGPQALSTFKAKPMYQELAGFVDFGTDKGLSAQDLAKTQLSRLIGSTTVVDARKDGGIKGDGEKKLEFLAELIESCMNIDPSLRISAADAVKVAVYKDYTPPPEVTQEDAPPIQQAVGQTAPIPQAAPSAPKKPSSDQPMIELVAA
jgi:serine/threonine-protein kinase PRP4